MDFKKILSNCEDISDEVVRKSRKILPPLGRALLISTFIEDGIRMFKSPADHVDYFASGKHSWKFPFFIACILFLFCSLVQIFGPIMIILRKKVIHAVCLLGAVLLIQTFVYNIYTDTRFLVRNVSIAGGLLLLLSESLLSNEKSLGSNQLPSTGEDIKPTSLMILLSRVYLVLMYLSIIHLDNASFLKIIEYCISFVLVTCIVVGFKTKLFSLLLAILLFFMNFFVNNWLAETNTRYSDYMKYDFFQTLSVVGALLMLIHLGPGEISIDDYKKKW